MTPTLNSSSRSTHQSILLVQPYRFIFRCEDPAIFPAGTLTNHLRGAFGLIFRRMVCHPVCPGPESCPEMQTCPYARLFAPRLEGLRAAGVADPPRSYVLRAPVLDELRLMPGDLFSVDLHLFDLSQPCLRYFIWAYMQLSKEGLGPQRARVSLTSVVRLGADRRPQAQVFDGQSIQPDAEANSVRLSLVPRATPVHQLRLLFLTPTVLRIGNKGTMRPDFVAIVARAWDRINALSGYYQSRGLDADFRGMCARARGVHIVSSDTQRLEVVRHSVRTGERHELSGFIGSADYFGDLTEFVPYLQAAYWTGIGKHSVWGSGAIQTIIHRTASPCRWPRP